MLSFYWAAVWQKCTHQPIKKETFYVLYCFLSGLPESWLTIKCSSCFSHRTHTHHTLSTLSTLSPCPNAFTSSHNYSLLRLLILHTYCMISWGSNSIKDLISSEHWLLFGWADGDEWASDGEDGIRVPPNCVTCQLEEGDWCWSNVEESSAQDHSRVGWTRPAGVLSSGIWTFY